MLYGLYRALAKPGMSVVLTVISLGTRVALAYLLSSIPFFRSDGNLVVCADWLGIGRYYRIGLLQNKKEKIDLLGSRRFARKGGRAENFS